MVLLIKKAFTLIELLVVMTIMAVLSTLGFIGYSSYLSNGNDFKRASDMALIQGELATYRREHGGLYPQGSSGTQIQSGATIIGHQYRFDETVAGALGIPKVPKDPRTDSFYIYAIRQDKRSYQITASMENPSTTAFWFQVAYAWYVENPEGYVSYVQWDYVPVNKNVLPGLLYAVTPGSVFQGGTPPSFDIATPANLSKAIIHGQKINLAYDVNGNMYAGGDGSFGIANLLANVPLVETGTGTAFLSCLGTYYTSNLYQSGENEVLPYMGGTSINAQIGWQYHTCDGNTGNMSAVKYSCANISGAIFDATCRWTGCQSGYVPVQSPSSGAPACRADLLPPTLAYPQNGAYGLPADGTLAWNPVAWSDGTYISYLGSSLGSMAQLSNGASLSTSYSSLASGTTYYWKVRTCDASATCKESTPWSFTISGSGSGGGGGGGGGWGGGWSGSTVVTDNCPSGIICRTDDVTVSYVGCSNSVDGSAYSDCQDLQDSFGTSEEAYPSSPYGMRKVISYRIRNNSMGTAKFSVQFGTGTTNLTAKPSTTNPDSAQWYDTTADGVNNLYWTAWGGCSVVGGNIYSVPGNTSCFVLVYGRSDHGWPDSIGTIGYLSIQNEDSINGAWSFNSGSAKPLKGKRFNILLPWCRLAWSGVSGPFDCSLR